MAVVTKFRIKANGTMEAGQFIADRDKVAFNVNSEAHVFDLDESADQVKITSDGVLHAKEFREI